MSHTQASVTVSQEMRTLYRAYVAERGGRALRARGEAGRLAAPATQRTHTDPWAEHPMPGGAVCVQRTGRRPLVARGAVLVSASSRSTAQARGYWHELALYQTNLGLIAAFARRHVDGPDGDGEHRAMRLNSPDDLRSFVEGYAPEATLRRTFDEGGEPSAVTAFAEASAEVRADLACLAAAVFAPGFAGAAEQSPQRTS